MTDSEERAPRVSRAIIRRSLRLLHMEYKPSEIAEVIGVTPKTIYDTYILAGLPHRRDVAGNIWIVGDEFRQWAETALERGKRYAAQKRQPIGEDEAYCLRCKQVRKYKDITKRVELSKNRIMVYGVCAGCDGKISSIKKGKNDKSWELETCQ